MSAGLPAALPEVLDIAAVAQLMDCEPSTVEAAARERRLPGLKLGRTWRFPRTALLQALNALALANVQPPTPPAPAPRPKRLQVVPPTTQATPRRRGAPPPLPDPPAPGRG